MTPTIGRIVHYRLSLADTEAVNRRRNDAALSKAGEKYTGFQVHVGNLASLGDVLPMIIVRWCSGDEVQGQVFLDGNDTLWVKTVGRGDEPGQWDWPKRADDWL